VSGGGRPRVLTVVGNRPQLVKAAAVSRPLRSLGEEVLVHSGQHYDRELSQVFFDELELPPPDHELGVGSGTHAEQTARAMVALEPLAVELEPEALLVYGDTNTTLAATLVAAKLRIPVAHVEAGMRSFDRSMPEEVNRVAVDHLSDLLLCPTPTAAANLEREGLADRALLVGDVMADVARQLGPLAERRSRVLERLGLERGAYLLATAHRAANVDDPAALGKAVELLLGLAELSGPLLLPLHPRTRARLSEHGLLGRLEGGAEVRLLDPLGYLDLTCLMRGARAVATDSGGLQKEAFLAGVPCLTLRRETEWAETLQGGWNRLVGLDAELARRALEEVLAGGPQAPPDAGAFGDGEAGPRCAAATVELATRGASGSSGPPPRRLP
jgi:UDP-N-acetylglucosamine 2-epimerase (non-hydrolysing)/UDP-GlcNAc3NAcA epimerase